MLEWVDVCTAAGVERRAPGRARLRLPALEPAPGEVVSRASFELSEAEPAAVKATLAEMRGEAPRGAAVRDQDLRLDLQEPRRRRAPRAARAGQLLEAAGCRGLTVGGARLSPKHANFVENAGEATTADVLAVMAEGRRRVHERFGVVLEPEVQVLGEVEWPPTGSWTGPEGEPSSRQDARAEGRSPGRGVN